MDATFNQSKLTWDIVIWRYAFEFVVDTKTRGCVVKVTVKFSSKFSNGTTNFFSSQKWSAHWKTMNGCIHGIYWDYKFSRHLFKSFPEPIIWARCSIISACVLCCYRLFTMLVFASILRRRFSDYIYRFNAIYSFSMCWWFWDGKKWVLPFENFVNLSLTVQATLLLFTTNSRAFFQIIIFQISFRSIEQSGR